MRVLAFIIGMLSIANALSYSDTANAVTKVDSKLTNRNLLQNLVTHWLSSILN
jgi:Na+/H+ antiporter NhaD/arsenite permease-like protein